MFTMYTHIFTPHNMIDLLKTFSLCYLLPRVLNEVICNYSPARFKCVSCGKDRMKGSRVDKVVSDGQLKHSVHSGR